MTLTETSAEVETAWWTKPFEMFQTNLRETDAGLDVEAVLDRIVAFGADTWLVNAGGIYSFYPTRLAFQTRNPYLSERASGDLLGDAVEAAHRRGVRLMARMDFSKVAMPIAKEHPEWCFVDANGQWQVQNGLVSVSPSGEYFQERIFDILDEVIDRYEVDGFFFNWFGFSEIDYSSRYRGVSQDAASREAFAEFSGGRALPTDPKSPDYDLWRIWSAGVIRDLAERIHRHIQGRRPDAGLILRRGADILFHEANNEVGRELWASSTGENVSVLRSHRPEVTVLVNSVAFFDMPYRMASERPERFVQYLVQAIARGANPSTYIMGVPGDIPYPVLEEASRITRFHAAHRDIYHGLRPAAEIGLVRPDPLAFNASRHEESISEFRGLYSALQERHLPFDVVPAEGLVDMGDDGGLDRYRLLVLPDLDELSEPTIAALDAFVAGGGRLILTGRSAMDRQNATQLASSPVAGFTAATLDPQALKSTYVTLGRSSGADEPAIVPVYGAHYEVELRPEAEGVLSHLAAAPFGPPEKAHGNHTDGQPGFAISAAGDVIVVPWTIGRAYHDLGLPGFQHIVADAVDRLLPKPVLLTADLPSCVEVTVQSAPGRLVIHLINLSGRGRRNFGPALPVASGRLRVRGSGTVRALVTGSTCQTAADGDSLVIELPPLADFEVLVIEEEPR